MLELSSQFGDGAGARLLHFATLWLMEGFGAGHSGGRERAAPPSHLQPPAAAASGLVSDRGVCALLHLHRRVLCPALVSHLRDQLVALVMLSDDLCLGGVPGQDE